MWKLKEVNEEKLSELKKTTKLKEAILRTLLLRGADNEAAIHLFLYPDLKNLFSANYLPQIERALERIKLAIKQKEKILIWGHDDMDGITATAILKEVISDLRGEVFHCIPKKHEFKHGIYPPKVLEYPGINLLVAVDCGTTNFDEVTELKEKGIDTLIIDHHEVIQRLPPAVAIVNPKLPESNYPFPELAAAGVAFKFTGALIKDLLGIELPEFVNLKPELVIFSALGTISDRVPLLVENRIIVKEGIKRFRESTRPGVALISNFEEIATLFSLFGAIEGTEGVKFLLTQDEKEAKSLFDKMLLNYESLRREFDESYSLAETVKDLSPGIVLVKNIFLSLRSLSYIANRFKEKYQRPVIVLGKKNSIWVAECRGIDEVNLLVMLKEFSHLLIDWGGHKKACGFSIEEKNLAEFIKKAKEYGESEFRPKINKREPILYLDAVLPISEIPKEVFLLPPFGEGNPLPFFLSPNTTFNLGDKLLPHHIEGKEVSVFDETGKILSGGRYNIIYTVHQEKVWIKEVEKVE